MRKTLYFIPVLFLALGCGKNNDNNTPAVSAKTKALTQAAWKLETVGLDRDKNGTLDVDLSSQIDACIRDNTLKFESNGSGVSDEGPTKCSTSSSQSTPFTWAFVANETALTITSSAILGYGGQYNIVTLTDTKMSLSKDTTLPLFGNTAVLANFIH